MSSKYLHSSAPPCNITIFKGYKNGVFTRALVKFATKNPFALELYRWLYDTACPEEHFMPTLLTLSTFQAKEGDIGHNFANRTMTIFQRLDNAVKQVKEEPGTWERRTG